MKTQLRIKEKHYLVLKNLCPGDTFVFNKYPGIYCIATESTGTLIKVMRLASGDTLWCDPNDPVVEVRPVDISLGTLIFEEVDIESNYSI